MIEIDIPIGRHIWWTQNRRSRTWVTPYQRKKTVKRIAHLIFLDHINRHGGKRPADTETETPDIYELCSQCNASFMAFMQKDDASFEAWLKEAEQ